jgi:putative toxin-antitoxin system antitoxin component (TIGR02293 family)
MKKVNEVSEPAVAYGRILESDILALIHKIRAGVSFALFEHIVRLSPFTIQDWSAFLHLSERSMQRYKKDQKNFDALQSEKIVEISRLYQRGINVFGNNQKFNLWLESPSVALGGYTPKSFLDSSIGIQLIQDELGRIEHGIFA